MAEDYLIGSKSQSRCIRSAAILKLLLVFNLYKKIQEEIDHYYFEYFPVTFLLSIAEHA